MSASEHNTGPGLEIAVIGMAGRFPGAGGTDEFWENLKNGVESVSFFSSGELEETGLDPAIIENPGYVKAKGFLDRSEYFDSSFFGYTPGEAAVMDPQVRIFHECAWEALENAGYVPGSYNGLIGLYAGASPNLYWEVLSLSGKSGGSTEQFLGSQLSDKDFLSSRVSYNLDLKGPAVVIQSACSTSLVAVDAACRGLLTGQCAIALAGGVTVTLPDKSGYSYQEGMILSPDGHCRAFDKKSKGTLSGNGAGVVVLKTLEDAAADGDYIHAVIKGSAVNNDGKRKIGFSAPSINGQAEVIRAALYMAEIEPERIGYIETHGTGTGLGDSIEIEALKRVFQTVKKGTCPIGSVKTNVGHLGSAAGIAGLIKTILALKHKQIPPSLHFETADSRLGLNNSPFYVNTGLLDWKSSGYPLRAGISSFGIGGTNAHVILEEWPDERPREQINRGRDNAFQLIILSAGTRGALAKAIRNLADYFNCNPGICLADAAYTLQSGRSAFQYRSMLVCTDTAEAARLLARRDPAKYAFQAKVEKKPAAFMFQGLGAQYVGMGLELYQKEKTFAREMDRCFEIIKSLTGSDLKEILYPGSRPASPALSPLSGANSLHPIEIAQPVLFAFEYALAAMLMKWGITPCAMIGCSLGEYTAACTAGVFSLEDALKLVVTRGKLLSRLPTGVMLNVPLPKETLIPLLPGQLSLAIDNGLSCIVAGSVEAISAFEQQMKTRRCLTMRLPVSHAAHSHMLDPILDEFEKAAGQITLENPQIPLISNVTGTWLQPRQAVDPGYWTRHFRETVQFDAGITLLAQEPDIVVVEIGPGRDLSTTARRYLQSGKGQEVINPLKPPGKDGPDMYYLLKKIGQLWLYGTDIDWQGFHSSGTGRRIPLPTYPFEGRRFRIPPYHVSREENGRMVFTPGRAAAGPGEDEELSAGVTDQVLADRWEVDRENPYQPPRTPVQKIIAETWKNVLGIREPGIEDDFFQLGGDSLKAIIAIGKIHETLHVEIPLEEFFKGATIKKMARYIETAGQNPIPPINPVPEKEYYELSSAQKRLYVLRQMEPDILSYNLPMAVTVNGVPDRERLQAVFAKLVQRHESLRTSFLFIAGEPAQRIHNQVEFKIEYLDPAPGETGVETCIRQFIRPFDLSVSPLLRAGLIRVHEAKHILVTDMHHIAADGTSIVLLIREFAALYGGRELPHLKVRYRDFSLWQNRLFKQGHMKKQGDFWLEQMNGEIPLLHLPLDYSRPQLKHFEGRRVSVEIPPRHIPDIHNIQIPAANRTDGGENITLYMFLLAVFNIFLWKMSGQEDIIVGSPTAGRRHPGLQYVIGMFVNTLALRNFPSAEKTAAQFLAQIKERTLKALENQDYQFEILVERLAVNRGTGRNPLFDVEFVFQDMEARADELPREEISGLRFTPCEHETRTSKFDLTLVAREGENSLWLTIEYCTKLFEPATITRFITYFRNILFSLLENPGIKLGEIEYLPDAEKQRLLLDFNETGPHSAPGRSIAGWFARQVARTPDNIALADCFQALTYSFLDKKSTRLAGLLKQKGVNTDTIAAITAGPTLEFITGILAILKAGGAYLPIDPQYPQERINYMLADSGAKIWVTGEKTADIETTARHDSHPAAGAIKDSSRPAGNLAYVIYTSGTTGKSRGVLIGNDNLAAYSYWFGEKAGLTGDHRALLTSSPCFDLGYTSIYPALLRGCQVHIVPEEIYLSPEDLLMYILTRRITFLKVTPSLFGTITACSQFTRAGCRFLRFVVLGGEAIKLTDVEKAHAAAPHMQIMNHYGPTEATIGCIAQFIDFKCFDRYARQPAVGYPLGHVKVLILDKALRLVPVNVPGEICISGAGVGRGYLNNPELTAEKFNRDLWNYHNKKNKSFLGGPGGRFFKKAPLAAGGTLYRTGDLGRWLPEGNIQFLGRIDNQVKIRGFRIELGEIETRLSAHKQVMEAVVISQSNACGDNYLCAYITADRNKIDGGVLREYLSAVLPAYMIPAYFIILEKMPLTPNGKVNRKLLPRVAGETAAPDNTADYTAPRDAREKKMADLWLEILGTGIKKISIHDDFFQLGGHSLSAILLLSRIHKEFHVKVKLSQMFKTPTLKELTAFIKETDPGVQDRFTAIEAVEKREFYPLSKAQKRMFTVHQLDKKNTAFNIPRVALLEGNLDIKRLEISFQKLVYRHESFRTSFTLTEKEPVQRVHEAIKLEIDYYETGNREKIIADFVRPFDLSRVPLLRVGIIKTVEPDRQKQYILMLDMHHIVSDGVSTGIFIRDFMTLYRDGDLPGLRLQYKDYAVWQHRVLAGDASGWKKYWLERFSGKLPVLDMPTDHSRPPVQSFAGGNIKFEIDKTLTAALRATAGKFGATLYMVLLAVYTILLARYTGQDDIIIGTPAAGRRHADLDDIIGFFINVLPMRNFPKPGKSFADFLTEVKTNTINAFDNQDYQLDDLVEDLDLPRDSSRNPLYDAVFAALNLQVPGIELPGLRLRPYGREDNTSKTDLRIGVSENPETISMLLTFSTALFEKDTALRMAKRFVQVTRQVMENPQIRIRDITISEEIIRIKPSALRQHEEDFDFLN